MTTEEFIEKARTIHGDKYDYSESIYINSKTHLTIICKTHDRSFSIQPTNHLAQKQGCPICAMEKRTFTTEVFIEKARKVHGDKYDYSKTVYKKNGERVTVVCDKGHEFQTVPREHIHKKSGCPYCYGNKRYTPDGFIELSKSVHGDRYDYSKCVYVNSVTNVIVICERGHEFHTNPTNHTTKRSGCPQCYRERQVGTNIKYFRGKPTILYYVKIGDVYKIGITTQTIKQRFYGQTKGRQIRVIKEWFFEDGADAYTLEQSYKKQFREFKYITTDYIHGGNQELYYKDVLGLDNG